MQIKNKWVSRQRAWLWMRAPQVRTDVTEWVMFWWAAAAGDKRGRGSFQGASSHAEGLALLADRWPVDVSPTVCPLEITSLFSHLLSTTTEGKWLPFQMDYKREACLACHASLSFDGFYLRLCPNGSSFIRDLEKKPSLFYDNPYTCLGL